LLPVEGFSPNTFNVTSIGRALDRSVLRVTEGPQIDSFPKESCQLFAGSVYRVSEDTNRMGVRLTGPPLPRIDDEDIITEGVSLGAIQVSHDGQPIILFVEHQTTGGYPKIANVISADLHKIGQLRPRDEVRFELVSLEQAESLLEELESHMSKKVLTKQ
jgi:allophanate hydrolase subunit 2